MSRSSASEGTRRPAGPAPDGANVEPRDEYTRTRGQVEPLAALAAVLAVGIAVSLYATVLSDVDPGPSTSDPAETALSAVHRNVSDGGLVLPRRVQQAIGAAPPGYGANVTLTTGGETWRAGPVPPASASSASRQVSVRLGPGNVRPGRLTVVIWS